MGEIDSTLTAWTRSPVDYLASRPEGFAVPRKPFSLYVPMRDGCRIALDVYLPQALVGEATPARFPTIVLFTCYYRRFAHKPGTPEVDPNPNTGRYRDFFVARGYAVVVVDARGTGASFGTRDAFRSPNERLDTYEVADWIVAQPWSDGTIGSTGVSYVGASSTFLASTGHPAVKAVAPICAVWDSYGDHFYPGGAPTRLAETNDDMARGLDQNRPELLGRFAYFTNPSYDGPQPVDDDRDGALLAEAIAEHCDNFVMSHFWDEFRFSDDHLPYDPGFTPAAISPNGYLDGYRDDIAVLSISGWYDGAGFANAAISRFLTLANGRQHLLLGGWDHGARINISPWRESVEPQFPVMGEILRFFDHYVRGLPTGLEDEAPIHYYSVHAETWHGAAAWPPTPDERTLHLTPNAALADKPEPEGATDYKVRFSVGTGRNTRFERLLALDCRDYYSDWHGRDAEMASFTSAPLDADLEIAGHPVATLHLVSDQPDAVIHLYLSEVDAEGRAVYITEGVLRACHHAEETPPAHYRATWPWRSLSRKSATLLVPGEPVEMRMALLPIAWRFAAGSRIRLSLSGQDVDHFAQVPHGRPPALRILPGSTLHLPVLSAAAPFSQG